MYYVIIIIIIKNNHLSGSKSDVTEGQKNIHFLLQYESLTICSDLSAFSFISIIFVNN